MKLRAIILGCGSSGGVPRPGGLAGKGDWGDCDPSNPKNRRMRCSILVQRADEKMGFDAPELTSVLVDTSPDLREQLLLAETGRLDGVVMTHDHADQSHGIDDLRVISSNMKTRVPVWIDQNICPDLVSRFNYCFSQPEESSYPAILEQRDMAPQKEFLISGPTGDIPVLPFLQRHGNIDSLGFLFGGQGGIAYSSDTNDLPKNSFETVAKAQSWIVDCLREKPHPSHAHLKRTLKWLKKTNMQRGIMTNMHIDLDYNKLRNKLPRNAEPAYDGMIISVQTK